MKPTRPSFDLEAAQKEFVRLQNRTRRLERRISAALREQLRTLSLVSYQAREAEKLLAGVRRLIDVELPHDSRG